MAPLDLNEYLHLISDPTDKKGHFITRLGKTFEFSAEDRVYLGLKELALSCQHKTELLAPKNDSAAERLRLMVFAPYLCGGIPQNIEIDSGYYTRPSLVDFVNTRIRETLGDGFKSKDLKLWYNPNTQHIEFFVSGAAKDPQRRFSLLILPPLSQIVGIQDPTDPIGATVLIGATNTTHFPNCISTHLTHGISQYEPSIKSFDLIFLYLNVLKKVCVGTSLVSLADIFPKTDCITGHSYSSYRTIAPKYIRLASHLRSLRDIEVVLTNEVGEILEFSSGTVPTRITLHMVTENNLPRS